MCAMYCKAGWTDETVILKALVSTDETVILKALVSTDETVILKALVSTDETVILKALVSWQETYLTLILNWVMHLIYTEKYGQNINYSTDSNNQVHHLVIYIRKHCIIFFGEKKSLFMIKRKIHIHCLKFY